MERRKEAAREILLDEIRRGSASPTTDDIDESVSILYRYWRAAQEGAGRLNLRLLASVYAGQVRDKSIVADRLSVLRRPACIFTTRRNHPAGYIFAVLNKCGRDAACGSRPNDPNTRRNGARRFRGARRLQRRAGSVTANRVDFCSRNRRGRWQQPTPRIPGNEPTAQAESAR